MSFADEILARIRAWPPVPLDDLPSLVGNALACWVPMFGSSGAVVTWELREEPGLTIASHGPDGFRWDEIADVFAYRPLVSADLEQRARFDAAQPDESTIHADLRRDYGIGRAISVPIAGEVVEGYAFILEPSIDLEDALSTASVMAALLAFRMDAVLQRASLRAHVASEERMRVARDLHDGLLQSFTGVVLQLETVHALLGRDPQEAGRLLTQVQAAIMSDQRELRAFVESLRPRRRAELTFDFAARLHEIRQRFEEQWGIQVTIHTGGVDPQIHRALGQETFRIVQEAITNAARHGGATHVDVTLRTTDGNLVVDVTDDGVGLPVTGRLTLSELRERGIGPASLRDRVAAMNGQLTAESSDAGLRLEITLPLGWSAA
jgi:signal transduction histidine kinase